MTLSQSDYYPWTYYIVIDMDGWIVNKKTKHVGELHQRIVEEWEVGNNLASM